MNLALAAKAPAVAREFGTDYSPAERLATGLMEAGVIQNPSILAYLNRLSDLLWLFGRLIEARRGVDSSLRTGDKPGPRWSRAW